ncbi:MAG TPA: CoA ester lyase [Alphaproteobacteria bacterium]|nr:CoA ester lyase [Alphaproteobacteria bacterium]
MIRPRRSVLYMPGTNQRAIEKGRNLPADVLVLDLEDSVSPDHKENARRHVHAAVAAGGFGQREIVIRINGLGTQWGQEDLRSAVKARPDAILVPKVSCREDILRIENAIDRAGADDALRLWAMMETPRAVLDALSIAGTAERPRGRLAVFVMGTNDLAKETRTRLTLGRAPMMPWLTTCVAAARAYGLEIIDGVFNGLDDEPGFRAECIAGRDLGMDGKSLIHPKQIGPCNDAFSPSADEIAWARKVIAAFDAPGNKGAGVLRVDGQMVERLHAEMARRVIGIGEVLGL